MCNCTIPNQEGDEGDLITWNLNNNETLVFNPSNPNPKMKGRCAKVSVGPKTEQGKFVGEKVVDETLYCRVDRYVLL